MSKSPKWYHGWNIVIAASIMSLITAGIRMSTGPFFMPILESFNMSRTSLSAIISISMIIFGIGMPLAGFLERRFGPKLVLNLGVILNFISTIWMITTSSPISLLFSFGILTSIGLSFAGQVTLTPLITKWFVEKRGQALFYLSTGSMAGIALMNPVSNFMILNFSWKIAMMTFSIVLLIIVFMITTFIIRDVDDSQKEDLNSTKNIQENSSESVKDFSVGQALQTSTFWYLSIGLFACGYSMNLIGSHGVPMLTDHGFTSTISTNAIGMIGLVAIPGTIIMGSFADKVSKKWLLSLIYITRGIGIIFFVIVTLPSQLYLVALIAGLAWAGNNSLASAILSNVYGTKNVGVLYGLTFVSHQAGATISTFLGGWTFDQFGTHYISFLSAGIILLIAGLLSLNVIDSNKPVAYKVKSKTA